MNKLKFQDTANIGDTIKAFDFEPMTNRDDMFIIGTVVKKGFNTDYPHHASVYQIVVTKDSNKNRRVGKTYFIPMEMLFDFNNRIIKVAQ